MRLFLAAAALALAALAATTAFAQTGTSGQGSPGTPQWASVNVCRPGAVGVRAGIPGDSGADAMQVRFALQWFSRSRGQWLVVPGAGTGWIDAGSAAQTWAQRGYTFDVNTPGGARYMFRGIAELRWTRGGDAVRSAVLSTGYCTIR
jgi:hypothetical protein